MKEKHTPGPWKLYHLPFLDADNGIDLKGNNGNTLIANFPTLEKQEGIAYTPSDEDAANLLLIAAAPELLAALEGMLRSGPSGIIGQQFARDLAIAVILKAKGDA